MAGIGLKDLKDMRSRLGHHVAIAVGDSHVFLDISAFCRSVDEGSSDRHPSLDNWNVQQLPHPELCKNRPPIHVTSIT